MLGSLITWKNIAFFTQFTCYFVSFSIPFSGFMLVLCVCFRYFTCRGLCARKQCETEKTGAKCAFNTVMTGTQPALQASRRVMGKTVTSTWKKREKETWIIWMTGRSSSPLTHDGRVIITMKPVMVLMPCFLATFLNLAKGVFHHYLHFILHNLCHSSTKLFIINRNFEFNFDHQSF